MSMRNRFKAAKAQMMVAQGGSPEALERLVDEDTTKSLDKVGMDVANYSDSELKAKNAESIRRIRQNMAGSGLEKLALTFGGSTKDRAMLGYLSALVEQNWILMRQNELLINALDKMAERKT